MITFLRQSRIACLILTILRIFIGIQWLEAALGKLLSEQSFNASGLISSGLNNATAYPWFHSFLSLTTNGGTDTAFFNVIVPWGQLLVGLALIFGAFTLGAAFFGLVMNVSFILMGAVSENPTFILIQVLILVAGYNAARIGFDYKITPFLRNKFNFLHNDIPAKQN